MTIKEIKRGRWYETTQGVGKCITAGGTRPPSVMVEITQPIPRGRVNLKPRDVLREVEEPASQQS